jgi:hypothetical protein
MCPNLANKRTPPKFAVVNGFVIGSFPQEIEFTNKDGKKNVRNINDNELTDLLKAMLAPLRPYGCVFTYSGGSQKSITGNYQFFEMEQNSLGAVISHLNQAGIGEHIYCVLCGRMTPDQKQIVHRRAVVGTHLFIDILTWFVKESGHPGFHNTTVPEECPKPLVVEDQETVNNTDKSINVNVETNIESGTYYFSSAQEPSENTSVYGSSDNFALAMFQCSAPTLLAYGGTYANLKEINVKNILPFVFPFGIGGPRMKQKVKVSYELCIQLYMKLSLRQSWKAQQF